MTNEEYAAIIRSMIEHENQLINHRLTWLAAFQGFLQRHAATDLADNAQFWIGEARLRRGDVNGALAAFRETVDRFPHGNKVPDALFRTGDCLEKLGDLDGARGAWRSTIERFPNSAAAALSEERLAAAR